MQFLIGNENTRMAIKLAFSTVACPNWGLEQVARRAQEMGYQGVELRTLGAGSTGLASDPALTDPDKVAKVFKAFGVEPVCLSTSLALHYKEPTAAHQAIWQVQESMKLAANIGCQFVRVFAHEVTPGENRQLVLQRIGERLAQLGDNAADAGVQLLLENAGSFTKAKEWWWLLNLADNPLVGMCWNVANAAAVGEPPSVSVPMLNSRIRMAKVKDTVVGEGSGFVPLGEGTVGVKEFVERLLGIGFDGYVSVEWDRLWLPSLTPAEEYLPDAQKRLKGWLDAVAKSIEDAIPKPKGAKAAAASKAETAPQAAAH